MVEVGRRHRGAAGEAGFVGGRWGGVGDDVVEGLVRRLGDVAGALGTLLLAPHEEEDLPAVLDRICREVPRAVPDADAVSVTLPGERGPETGAATDRLALELDLAQYRAGEGPCLEAARTGRVQRVIAAEVPGRWPAFGAEAGQSGVTGFLSVPLRTDEDRLGSLNLYGARSGFGKLDVALAEVCTTAVEAALRNARHYLRARGQVDQVRRALTSRAVIDQAKGIVMAVHRIGADEAFAMLVERSQQENVKVRDVAERFVDDVVRGG
ncbi:GAF and ANTAR domain-containing protein [Saccharothrix longispora]|uniref:GAF domain-containing protein n=1 Tax=Saccharothrix longispora TaxID=33920 RepID=A0ABU1PMI9_9PSEU|nr:GAF and ANTAR domain-containing protein [Saccharothrix longispora]MDR6591878.1 GAF domain-containing protein [Saccharothrix longispora]